MFKTLKAEIDVVFQRDPAARNLFEVVTCYPGFHAVLLHRANHWLWTHNCKWLGRFCSTLARWLTGIEIHPGAIIGRRFFIDHGMGVVIGETAEIGDDCTLYHGVTLGGTSWEAGKRHPTLGNDVVVGAGAKVLGPIRIGDGARVGSNAVVTKDVPEATTVVGVPGRLIQPQPLDEQQVSPEQREAIRRKYGFDAYGLGREVPDPVAKSIHALLTHVHAIDEKVNGMCEALRELGSDYCAERLPDIEDALIELTDTAEQDGDAAAVESRVPEEARKGAGHS